jgi:hypothetical protein
MVSLLDLSTGSQAVRRHVSVGMLVVHLMGFVLLPMRVSAQPGEDEGWAPMVCPATTGGSTPFSFQQRVFWRPFRRTSVTNIPSIAWYVGDENPFLDATRRWEWLSPGGLVECSSYEVLPGFFVEDFKMSNFSGNVVPYGRDEVESEITTDPGSLGGDGGNQFDDYHICWYYRYPDGSRSAYYRCDPL